MNHQSRQPPPPPEPCSVVELTIACKNLKNLDVLSKSDPMCVISVQKPGTGQWTEIGRTEVVMDNLNPEFSTKISMTYMFEERQLLRFDVYDIDSQSSNLADHDFIGSVDAALGEIVSCSSLSAFERDLLSKHGKAAGKIRITAEELSSFREAITIKLAADSLPKKFFGVYSFFFEIHKSTETSGMMLVYRSPTMTARSTSVEWRETPIKLHSLCNGDVDRSIKITLLRHKSNGSHKSLGSWDTTVRSLTDASTHLPTSAKLKTGPSFRLVAFSKGSHSTFLDFIKIGVQMHCTVAVDFTQSNGDPRAPNSLHYMHPTMPNQYQTALRSVLEIIQDYDSDKLFPALGFGALIPPAWEVSHEFFLNFHPSNPYCEGVEGVMAAYTTALSTVRLYGPTNFSPVINHVSRFASANRDGRNYFILLIITDGVISDMAHTTNAIVAASSLPMSIIIVGVGQADFSAMDTLDADDRPLVDTSGRGMKRDIVQFVPFNRILQKAGNNITMAKADLAREVLAEVPRQFLSYMSSIGMTPQKVAELVRANLPS